MQKNNDHKHNESQTRYKLIFKKMQIVSHAEESSMLL